MTKRKDPKKSPRDTNGPVVRTGPTAGQNRSRNADGRWQAKKKRTTSCSKKRVKKRTA